MLGLQNNLKLALRNIRNQFGSSLLNIIGLTLGILGSIIIFLTVKYELSFDTQHKNTSEIYRVTNNYYYPTFTMYVGQTPYPMAKALATDFPDFERVFSIQSDYNHNISVDQQLFESDIIYCSAAFIEAFNYYDDPAKWIIGDPKEALEAINKTVITQSLAELLFKSPADAIGQTITLSDETNLEVAAIIQDPPNNTNYPFEQLVSQLTYGQHAQDIFNSVSNTTTFVQVPSKLDINALKTGLEQFNEKYMEPAWGEDFVSTALQPLAEIHFDERFGSNNYTTNKNYLWALGLIGMFLILIACINFVNLATAKAISKSKEIGMRKILGSSKENIIAQFMSESFILALIAVVLGLSLAQLSFPYFSELTNLNIGNDFTYNMDLILFISVLLVLITVGIGLYPAFVLSNFKPMEVIRKNSGTSPLKGLNLRRGLIAFQLTTSQVLVIALIVITYQLQFFHNKDLGFDKEAVLVVNIHGDEPVEKKVTLKNKISQLPFVQEASLSSTVPMTGHNYSTGLTSKDSETKERFNVEYIFADNEFASMMNFNLLAGKTELSEIELDTVRGFVVNETLIDRLAFTSPEEALGKRIRLDGRESIIVGVVEDFHTTPLHDPIKPMAMIYGVKQRFFNLGIKLNTSNLQEAVAQLESNWTSVFPDKNFDYYFMDQQLEGMYEGEIRFSQIIKIFTLISILIACIGLIGLAAFSSVKRFKEIGIRKVLGATVTNILMLISKEFIVLTFISFLISIPIAYFLTSTWLGNFAYQIQIEWWMVLGGGILTMFLTLLTVGLQSIKAALINPVESLRRE